MYGGKEAYINSPTPGTRPTAHIIIKKKQTLYTIEMLCRGTQRNGTIKICFVYAGKRFNNVRAYEFQGSQ